MSANNTSLLQLCLKGVVLNSQVLEYGLSLGLPGRIHAMLFSTATELLSKEKHIQQTITKLVSTWPQETFRIMDVLSDAHASSLLTSCGDHGLLFTIMEGLLNLKATSKLRRVDFLGYYAPLLFRLPILSLPPEERWSDALLNEIKSKCQCFTGEEDGNLADVLSWKVSELKQKKIKYNFQGTGPVDIFVQCQLDMTDWIAMDDEMLGLIIQERTPFRMKICKLAINNFHLRQTQHLKWLLSMTDKQVLASLVLYGKRKSTELLMWELHEELQQLHALEAYGIGTSGPKIKTFSEPTTEQIITRAVTVFQTWQNLQDVYFMGMMMKSQVKDIFSAMQAPLRRIVINACSLCHTDIDYLANSHHAASVEELSLQMNDFSHMGDNICRMVQNMSNLILLNVKETLLPVEAKLEILLLLQGCPNLHTLAMHENEDMLPPEIYETLVQLACSIPSLKLFYIFPFHSPFFFEALYGTQVRKACQHILETHERTDLQLFY